MLPYVYHRIILIIQMIVLSVDYLGDLLIN